MHRHICIALLSSRDLCSHDNVTLEMLWCLAAWATSRGRWTEDSVGTPTLRLRGESGWQTTTTTYKMETKIWLSIGRYMDRGNYIQSLRLLLLHNMIQNTGFLDAAYFISGQRSPSSRKFYMPLSRSGHPPPKKIRKNLKEVKTWAEISGYIGYGS